MKRAILIVGSVLVLGGCAAMTAAVPDWARPSNIAGRLFGGDDEPRAAAARQPGQFPQVTAPRAPAVTPANERQVAVAGLAADRANAQYTDEQLRQGGQIPVAGPVAGQVAPAPAPAPAVRVAQAPPLGPALALPAPAPAIGLAAAPAAAPATGVPPLRPTLPAVPGLAVPDLAQPAPPVFLGGPQVTVGGQAQAVPPPAIAVAPLLATPQVVAVPSPPVAVAPVPAPALPVAAVPLVVQAPVAAPQLAPAAPAAQAPALTPTQAQVQRVLPAQNAGGQDTLARTFTAMLAQSQGTVTVLSPLGGPPPVLIGQANVAAPAGANVLFPNVAASLAAARPQAAGAIALTPPGTGAARPQLNVAASGRATTIVNFAHDSTALDAEARRAIRAVADAYKARGGRVHVVGHASTRTKDMAVDKHVVANFNVSVDRARAVTDELLRLGVPPAALVVGAVGDAQPRFLEAMPAGEAGNRRVEINLEV